MATRPPSRRVCSIITTASAPDGIGAPVMISTACPAASSPPKQSPARTSPIISNCPGRSRERTAYPSRTLRARAGESRSAAASAASPRPQASARGIASMAGRVRPWRTVLTTVSRASTNVSAGTSLLSRLSAARPVKRGLLGGADPRVRGRPPGRRVLNRFGKPGTDTNFRRSLPEFGCLFECISMVLQSGSPEGYNAETGFCEPAQKPQSGEPYEHQTLYRIRRSQEKHQLLRQDRRRQDHRRGQTAGHAPGAAGMGAEAHGTLARGDGSDAIQQLDLRRAEAVCRRVADGEPLDDESHRGCQEEERPTGCAQDRRPGALQSAAGLLCGSAGDARSETVAALPEPGGGTGGADEEPNERAVDGSGSGIQQTATARGKIFQRVAGPAGRSAGIGEGSVAAEPWGAGDVRRDAAAIARPI